MRWHIVEAMLTRSEAFLEGAAMLPPTVQGSGSGGSSDRAKDRREDAMPFIHRVLILIIVHCTLPLLVEAGGWRWGGARRCARLRFHVARNDVRVARIRGFNLKLF